MTGDASKLISELAHETLFVPLDHPPGRQINVRGGGGKTTLAKAIAQKKTLSFIELDAIQWLPNWEERDRADFGDKTSQAIQHADGAWVVNGNYSGYIGDLVVKEAEKVTIQIGGHSDGRRTSPSEVSKVAIQMEFFGGVFPHKAWIS